VKQTEMSPRRKYDDAFKEQAVEMVMGGQSVKEVAHGLGISEYLIYEWKRKLYPLVSGGGEAARRPSRPAWRNCKADSGNWNARMSGFGSNATY
jgi:transposase-like protein